MMKKLMNFFENAPLEEVTAKLKSYGVEFTENEVNKYNQILENKKIVISEDNYTAEINYKLTYKKINKIKTDYTLEIKNLSQTYSSCEIGEIA